MPNVTTDEEVEAANILLALNESSEQLEVTDAEWADVWNVELESIFKIQPAEAPYTMAPEKKAKRITTHRVLTSPEIIQEKRDEEQEEERREEEKEERQRKRIKEENKSSLKSKPKKQKQIKQNA